MATSINEKKACSKCDKGKGIFTCDGCQQSFCRKHSEEHRQELSLQMDILGEDHDNLQRDINRESQIHSFLSHIDIWEQESIQKIQCVANQARIDLNKLIEQRKEEFKVIMNRLTNELQSSRQSEDYTEHDLKKWLDQLNKLRQELQQSINTYLLDDDDDQNSIIRLIKVKTSQQLCSVIQSNQTSNQNSVPINHEKFAKTDEHIILSENALVATYPEPDINEFVFISGANHYSKGVHHIPFRIEKLRNKNLFIGIVPFTQTNVFSFLSPTIPINGWLLDNYSLINGTIGGKLIDINVSQGNEITLTLNCNQKQIYFEHHQARYIAQLPIVIEKCPFPWKIIIGLRNTRDCIRIIS